MKYQAFLSYSHKDRKWAEWFHRRLESYRPPKHLAVDGGGKLTKRLAPIFRDRDELPSSADLSVVVNEALADSAALIVVCSPAAAASRWVNEEIRAFRALGKSDRIFAVIVDGEPNATDATNCFPAALLEGGKEPVAADARSSGDGRHNALLKIAAGVLNVGFDELRQRDLNRQHRRLAAVTAASLLIAVVTISLAVTATIARNDANLRRQQAEDLIGFMIGDLREQLHEVQRLDIFQSVGDAAMEYFSKLDEEDESDHSLSQRAIAIRHIGVLRQDQGDLAASLEAFSESELIMEELARRNPDDADTLIELTTSYFYVGYVHWEHGDLRQARERFERVLPIVTQLRERDPGNTSWLVESGYAYTNLGRVLEQEGSLPEALAAYEQVMLSNMELTELQPDEPEWQLELGFAHNNLGKLVTTLGRLDEATLHYRKDVELKTKVMQDSPDHELWRSYEADSEYFLGWLLANTGKTEEGVQYLEAALSSFSKLTELSPDHSLFLDRLSRVERRLADVLRLNGQFERASSLAESSIRLSAGLLTVDSKNTRWRRGLIEALLIVAEVGLETGDGSTVDKALGDAAVHIELLLAQEPENLATQQLAVRERVIGAHSGSTESAKNALDTLDQYFAESQDPWVIELRLSALDALGDNTPAERLQDHLREIGFRGSGQ